MPRVCTYRFKSYYAAKLEREQRENPTHWVIVPSGTVWFELRRVGGF